jgi:hypothetical protein
LPAGDCHALYQQDYLTSINITLMSKDRKTVKETKKQPTVNVNKKQSAYQSGKGSASSDVSSKK